MLFISEFKTILEKYKAFRELPDQYKTNKFILLYSKMYEYMLSIPKEKIVYKCILDNYIKYGLLEYISKFIEAKDFYHWKNRIYSLLTEKIHNTSYKKFELLYRSKAKEFFDRYMNKNLDHGRKTLKEKYDVDNPMKSKKIQEKYKATNLERYGYKNPMQSKEIKEKSKKTCLEKHGKEYYFQTEEFFEKSKTTCLELYGHENPTQSKEIQEKIKKSWKNKSKKEIKKIVNKRKATNLEIYGHENPMQSKEVQEKVKNTCMKNHGVTCGCLTSNNSGGHSKIADEFCEYIDKYFGYPEDSLYYTKGKELTLKSENNHIRKYDYTILSKKLIIEFQGIYTHALHKNPNDTIKLRGKNILAKDIWKYDEEKKILAEQNRYKVFYVYEDEYRKDPKGTINKLIKEIKNFLPIF